MIFAVGLPNQRFGRQLFFQRAPAAPFRPVPRLHSRLHHKGQHLILCTEFVLMPTAQVDHLFSESDKFRYGQGFRPASRINIGR